MLTVNYTIVKMMKEQWSVPCTNYVQHHSIKK